MRYSETDLEILYNAKTLFYEIGYDGQPIKHSDIVGDNHGDLLHIGIRDGEYNICYYIFVGNSAVEECIAGQKLLLKILNNGNIEPIESGVDTENIFNQLSESEEKYQPKLYLRFEPAIENDVIGINQLNKILYIIGLEYPEIRWFGGNEATTFNPFTDDEGDGVPEQVKSLTIGYWPDLTDIITYGQWDDNDKGYTNAIDGWEWLKERDVDTESIFDSLNESESNTIPSVTFSFEPPIEEPEELKRVLYVLNSIYPGLEWVNSQSVLTYDIYNEVFSDNSVVGGLSIGHFEENPNQMSWTSYADPSEHKNLVDGWEFVDEHSIDTESIFNQLNESRHQPKLYLRFDPPIYNDKVGINQLNRILVLIENEYSSVYWWENQSPAKYNPFTDKDEDIPDQVKSLTIGYWPDKPNRLTYGQWDHNDMYYQNGIDGWEWLKERDIDYDQTSNIFNQLNENEEENPKLTYVFEPPIEDKETLRNVLYVIGLEHPGIMWPTNKPILNNSIYREIFDDNEGYDFVGGLTIYPEIIITNTGTKNITDSDVITWTSWVNPKGGYSDYGPKVDGWQLVNKHSIPNTEDIFNQLNESIHQPKLNLRFEDGIYNANELDKVLQVLGMAYPGLKWMGGDSIITHNVIRNQEESFEFEPIYYLTIGYFSHTPDKLTYTSGSDDDSSFADDEHHNFNWVEGWQWVKDNKINYDETTNIFNQLNESKYFFIRL